MSSHTACLLSAYHLLDTDGGVRTPGSTRKQGLAWCRLLQPANVGSGTNDERSEPLDRDVHPRDLMWAIRCERSREGSLLQGAAMTPLAVLRGLGQGLPGRGSGADFPGILLNVTRGTVGAR